MTEKTAKLYKLLAYSKKIQQNAAKYIIFNFESNTLEAYDFIPDSLASFAVAVDTSKAEKPTFIDGESTFTYKKLRYNFKSKKGIISDVVTQQGEGYVRSACFSPAPLFRGQRGSRPEPL